MLQIAEARGNNVSYGFRGNNYVNSALHWGPTPKYDRYYWTQGWRNMRRATWADDYHTFGMEWNEDFLWTYVDSRVNQVISLRFNKESFWTRGKFPTTIANGSDIVKLTNIWSKSEKNVAPFDQEFYLIMNLGVGGTNGWFPDSIGGKPWIDDSLSAMSDFWLAKDKWYNTWPEDKSKRGLAVKQVKMVSLSRNLARDVADGFYSGKSVRIGEQYRWFIMTVACILRIVAYRCRAARDSVRRL